MIRKIEEVETQVVARCIHYPDTMPVLQAACVSCVRLNAPPAPPPALVVGDYIIVGPGMSNAGMAGSVYAVERPGMHGALFVIYGNVRGQDSYLGRYYAKDLILQQRPNKAPRFKVGDHVRALTPGVGTGTVTEVYRMTDGSWGVGMKRNGTPENPACSWRGHGHCEDQFEPCMKRPVRVGDRIRYRGWIKTEWPSGHEVLEVREDGFCRQLSSGTFDVRREHVGDWMHADGAPIDIAETFLQRTTKAEQDDRTMTPAQMRAEIAQHERDVRELRLQLGESCSDFARTDVDRVLELVLNPPPPTQALRDLMARHRLDDVTTTATEVERIQAQAQACSGPHRVSRLPKRVTDALEVRRIYDEMASPLGPQPRFTQEEEDAIKDALRKAYRAGEKALPEAWQDQDDRPLPEDEAIDAAFPTRSDRDDLYQEAMRLVGAKYTKGALVALVNWLLHRIEVVRANARANAIEECAQRCDIIEEHMGPRFCSGEIRKLARARTKT